MALMALENYIKKIQQHFLLKNRGWIIERASQGPNGSGGAKQKPLLEVTGRRIFR